MRWITLVALACSADDEPKTPSPEDTSAPTPETGSPPTDPGPTGDDLTIDCPEPLASPPAGEACAVDGDPLVATHLLLEGDVLGATTAYRGGGVLVELGVDARITCVGCDCSPPADTLRVSCPDAVVSPGLIDAESDLRWATSSTADHGTERFDNRADWRTGRGGHSTLGVPSDNTVEASTFGEVRMLLSGVTSMMASGEAPGLVRNLDRSAANELEDEGASRAATFPLGNSGGPWVDSGCDDYDIDSGSVLDAVAYLPHVAVGIDAAARNDFTCVSEAGLVGPSTSLVHAVGLTATDIAAAGRAGARVVWTPRSSVSLYGDAARVVAFHQQGVPIALGTDWVPTGSATVLRELACADAFNRDHLGDTFSDRDLWLMATRNAAVATGWGTTLGRLYPGFVADLAVFAKRGRSLHRAVLEADMDDVVLVLREGVPLAGRGDLLPRLRDTAACDSPGGCLADHLVCLDGGFTLPEITSAVTSGVPLTLCDPPEAERTCAPSRDDESGDGVIYPITGADQDGDGVLDADDGCPTVFDPPRPIDGGTPPDTDGDGTGDACDPCALDADDACTWRDPDQDGVEGLDDNCPDVANPDQADTDFDTVGDACEP